MSVIVKKSALVTLIKKLTSENRSFHSLDISEIPGKDTEIPIEPREEMAVQLSVEKPPVEDPDYSPTSRPDLAVAASAITDEVPDDQVKYFYQGLHKLLDLAVQRQQNKTRISESALRMFLESVSDDEDDDDGEAPIVDLAHDKPYVSPHEDYPSDLGDKQREYDISRKIDDIVDLIVKARLHIIEVPGTDITDFKTGQSRPEMTIVSAGAASYVIERALEKREIKREIDQAIDELKINRSVFMTMLMNDLASGYLGKEEKVDDDLAAEMFSNILIDKKMKEAEGDIEQFRSSIENHVATHKDFKDKKPEDKFSFSLSELGSYSVTVKKILDLIEDAKQDAISQIEGGSQPEEEGEAATEEGLSKAEIEEIRKMIREETLASEYEPGKLNLSQEAIRAFIEKISEETSQSIGDVRNIFYEDLKASGMDNEVLRKIFGLRRMPRGRQNIPLIYDPLKVRAEEAVVTKLYDVFIHNLGVFLEDRIDAGDPIASDLKDKLLGPQGLYQPGLEGYQRLQSVVGLPTEETDVDSSTFRDTRSAYEAVQEFIDIMAKDHIVPEDIKAKGGLKMIIKDFEENHDAFATLDEREDFDEFINSQIKMYDSFKRDSPRSQARIFDVIGKALSKAPKRRDRYIKKIKSERGSQ